MDLFRYGHYQTKKKEDVAYDRDATGGECWYHVPGAIDKVFTGYVPETGIMNTPTIHHPAFPNNLSHLAFFVVFLAFLIHDYPLVQSLVLARLYPALIEGAFLRRQLAF